MRQAIAYASTLTVTKIADTNDGSCDAADCSLREAVAAANPDDTIGFSELFNTPQTITLIAGQIAIDKNLMINGTGSDLLSVSGNNFGRLFYISGGATVYMTRMKLRDGNVGAIPGDEFGGAIRVMDSTLQLTHVELTNNTAFSVQNGSGDGGAVFGITSTVTLANVKITQNTAPGGAVYVDPGVVYIRDSIASNNTAGLTGETLNIENTTIVGNSANGISGEHLTIAHSLVKGNGRGVAGGDASSTLTVDDSVITENTDAGLTSFAQGAVSNSHNTITHNTRHP